MVNTDNCDEISLLLSRDFLEWSRSRCDVCVEEEEEEETEEDGDDDGRVDGEGNVF